MEGVLPAPAGSTPDVARGYRALGLPGSVDLETVAHEELRWCVVRREIGLASGTAAGESVARLYAAPDPDGPKGEGRAYWPEVARLLGES